MPLMVKTWQLCLGHTDLISCSTDPTDPIFADPKKIKIKVKEQPYYGSYCDFFRRARFV